MIKDLAFNMNFYPGIAITRERRMRKYILQRYRIMNNLQCFLEEISEFSPKYSAKKIVLSLYRAF